MTSMPISDELAALARASKLSTLRSRSRSIKGRLSVNRPAEAYTTAVAAASVLELSPHAQALRPERDELLKTALEARRKLHPTTPVAVKKGRIVDTSPRGRTQYVHVADPATRVRTDDAGSVISHLKDASRRRGVSGPQERDVSPSRPFDSTVLERLGTVLPHLFDGEPAKRKEWAAAYKASKQKYAKALIKAAADGKLEAAEVRGAFDTVMAPVFAAVYEQVKTAFPKQITSVQKVVKKEDKTVHTVYRIAAVHYERKGGNRNGLFVTYPTDDGYIMCFRTRGDGTFHSHVGVKPSSVKTYADMVEFARLSDGVGGETAKQVIASTTSLQAMLDAHRTRARDTTLPKPVRDVSALLMSDIHKLIVANKKAGVLDVLHSKTASDADKTRSLRAAAVPVPRLPARIQPKL